MIKYIKNNQQALILLSSSLTSMIIMLGINFILTRTFTKETFGNYAYIINVFLFGALIFNLGYFYSLGRIIALTDSNIVKRQLYSAGLLITTLLSFLMSILLYIYTFFVVPTSDVEAHQVLCFFSPLCLFFLVNNFNESALQGSNRISLLAFSRIAPKLIYVLLLTTIYLFNRSFLSLKLVFILYFIGLALSFMIILIRIRPSFINLKENLINVHVSNKEFGFNIYLGSLIAVGSTSLTGILISYFGVDNVEVGYYSISQQLAAPLSLVPNVLATVYFRKFARSKSIDKKIIVYVYLISLTSFALIYLIAEPIVINVYGTDYINSVTIFRVLAFGILLYGISDVYNRFLLSKGKGKELRNTSYIVGFILLFLNIILIQKFGAIGAATSTVISGSIYFIVISFYYNKVKKQYV